MSLKIVWKLRERKKELEKYIVVLTRSAKAVPNGSADPMLYCRNEELRFINELLGEKS